jgi:hypothetical protein
VVVAKELEQVAHKVENTARGERGQVVHEVLLRDTSTSARMLADVGILQAHDDSNLDDDEVQVT